MGGLILIAISLMLVALGCYQMSDSRYDINMLGTVWLVLGLILLTSVVTNMVRD